MMTKEIVIDTRSGATGSMAEWVHAFAEVWKAPSQQLDRLLGLLSDDVVLIAPTMPSVTKGVVEGRRAFERVFRAMPDLHAEILRWSADQDVLFIEMMFVATIGGRRLSWRNVDRFIFHNAKAVERVAFFNPSRVKQAFLSSPRGWYQLVRLRTGL